MSQHDYDIANQTAPNFRSDLNDALGAIATNNSGSTEPSVTYANQWWYDTSNNILKIRSEADDAWINVGYLDQSTNEFKPYIGSTQITDFLDEDDMASDSATAIPSQQSTKAYVDGNTIGIGQTWQDVSGSRSLGTTYQNTTGRPIAVNVVTAGNSSNENFEVSKDNSTWVVISTGHFNDTRHYHGGVIVPDGNYYRVFGGKIYSWAELL